MLRAIHRLLVICLIAAGAVAVTPATDAHAVSSSTYESDVSAYANSSRVKANKVKLRGSSCVDRYAEAQASRMARAKRMYHQDMMTIARACRLNLVGENVAAGFPSGRSVTSAWMASPGHRANMLHRDFRLIGVGAVKGSDGRWYVSEVFGRSA